MGIWTVLCWDVDKTRLNYIRNSGFSVAATTSSFYDIVVGGQSSPQKNKRKKPLGRKSSFGLSSWKLLRRQFHVRVILSHLYRHAQVCVCVCQVEREAIFRYGFYGQTLQFTSNSSSAAGRLMQRTQRTWQPNLRWSDTNNVLRAQQQQYSGSFFLFRFLFSTAEIFTTVAAQPPHIQKRPFSISSVRWDTHNQRCCSCPQFLFFFKRNLATTTTTDQRSLFF